MSFSVNVINAYNYRERHRPLLREALANFQNVVNTDEFQNLVLRHTPFRTPENLRNAEILSIFLAGRELLSDTFDNEADLSLELLYEESNNDVGYTDTSTGVIYTYRNMFMSNSPAFLAGHYAHEYCHLLGFRDPATNTRDARKHNVPYEIGEIVYSIASGETLNLHFN